MTLDEMIKSTEEFAEMSEDQARVYKEQGDIIGYWSYEEDAKEHRQLAEWLKELKESRIVLDILGQFLADMGTDICCEDLIMTDDYCENYCDNQKPLCWYRWAKLKASEVKADDELQ